MPCFYILAPGSWHDRSILRKIFIIIANDFKTNEKEIIGGDG
jgi:hypothetical protein